MRKRTRKTERFIAKDASGREFIILYTRTFLHVSSHGEDEMVEEMPELSTPEGYTVNQTADGGYHILDLNIVVRQ